MELIVNPKVTETYQSFPKDVRKKLFFLRKIVIDTARETEGVNKLEETLKWGEPSYISNIGSTIRINKCKNSEEYALYFICSTTLVETFRVLYGGQLRFEDNRGIIFKLYDELPIDEITQCVKLALTYKKIKHLPLLGV